MKIIFVKFGGIGQTYCFKTKDESIKFGDILESASYRVPMVVTAVVDKEYRYVNTFNGELTNEVTSTKCVPIKTIKLHEDDDIVYVHKVNRLDTSLLITNNLTT